MTVKVGDGVGKEVDVGKRVGIDVGVRVGVDVGVGVDVFVGVGVGVDVTLTFTPVCVGVVKVTVGVCRLPSKALPNPRLSKSKAIAPAILPHDQRCLQE